MLQQRGKGMSGNFFRRYNLWQVIFLTYCSAYLLKTNLEFFFHASLKLMALRFQTSYAFLYKNEECPESKDTSRLG
jgi:hypothetical protein